MLDYSNCLQQGEGLDSLPPVEEGCDVGNAQWKIEVFFFITVIAFVAPSAFQNSLQFCFQEGRYPHCYWTETSHLLPAPGQKENTCKSQEQVPRLLCPTVASLYSPHLLACWWAASVFPGCCLLLMDRETVHGRSCPCVVDIWITFSADCQRVHHFLFVCCTYIWGHPEVALYLWCRNKTHIWSSVFWDGLLLETKTSLFPGYFSWHFHDSSSMATEITKKIKQNNPSGGMNGNVFV